MKTPIILLLTIFSSSILIPTPAKSEVIAIKAIKDSKDIYYLDTSSINLDRSFTAASVSTKHDDLFYGALLVQTRLGVICSNKTMMVMTRDYYDLNGKSLGSDHKHSEWGAIKPGSMKEGIYNFLCSKYKR